MIQTNPNILSPLEQVIKSFTAPHAPISVPDQSEKGLFNPLGPGMEQDLPIKPEPQGPPGLGPMDRLTPTGDLGGGAVGSVPNFGASFGGGAGL